MLDESATSWCTIHRDRISRNLELALKLVPEKRRFCAVLKADAYGHGIAQVVPLIREQGIVTIGITSNAEARSVREAGFDGTLLRLRSATPQEVEGALHDRVEEQVASVASAQLLHGLREAGRLRTGVHLALNASGISRDALEISTPSGQDTCHRILDLLGHDIRAICTHFRSNEPDQLRESSDMFQRQADWVFENSDLQRAQTLVHAGSSLTLLADVEIESDMYRCGAILYGILRPELGFRPTMDLEARVISLQDYPKGVSVGYDGAHRLAHPARLACISIGYENGFRRGADLCSVVAVKDKLVPVLGKISMNAIVVNVTGIDGVEIGDTVSIFKDHKTAPILPHTAEAQFSTIMADLYTDWGRRNQRVYR